MVMMQLMQLMQLMRLMQHMRVKDECAPSKFGFGRTHEKTHKPEKAVGFVLT
jgi:hypothetical protein